MGKAGEPSKDHSIKDSRLQLLLWTLDIAAERWQTQQAASLPLVRANLTDFLSPVFQSLLDQRHKLVRDCSVNDTMIVSKCEVNE